MNQLRIVAVGQKDTMARKLYQEDVNRVNRADLIIDFNTNGTINLMKNKFGPIRGEVTREEFMELVCERLEEIHSDEELGAAEE